MLIFAKVVVRVVCEWFSWGPRKLRKTGSESGWGCSKWWSTTPAACAEWLSARPFWRKRRATPPVTRAPCVSHTLVL